MKVHITAREIEVAELVAKGLSNSDIARELFVARRTVATHIEHILWKLNFSSRIEIAVWITRYHSEEAGKTMDAECPDCGSPEPRLHSAVAPDGEVTRICRNKFHDLKPTLRISPHLGLYLHIPKKARLK